MKRPKPKPKTKSKRKSEQRPSETGEQALTQAARVEPKSTVEVRTETEVLARIVETRLEIENSARPVGLRDVTDDAESAVKAPSETETPAKTNQELVETEYSANPVKPRDEITNSPSAIEVPTETEEPARTSETPVETENSSSPVEFRDESEESADTVAEVQSETEEPARTDEAQVEVENSASPVEFRDEAADTASTVEIRDETEDLESIIALQVEVQDSASPVELRDVTGNPTVAPTTPLDIYDGTVLPVIPVDAPPVAEKPAPHSMPKTGADRRAHPRYPFTAPIEVVAAELGARIKSQVRDLSQQGCYVDTDSPLALGTATEVRITKGATAFDARARVVYNQAAKGMGLMFIAVELQQLKILDTWIAESRESSWRAANRRRSQRVLMKLPVRVSGQAADGASFEEMTHTLSISPHGALLVVAAPVQRGQRFILWNLQTKAALECVVAYLERIPGEPMQVGVEFSLPNSTFWRVAFPPKDWTPRHPDAKSR
jgi:PilZ domain